MGLEKETLTLIFPKELLAHFEIILAHELGHVEAKEDFIEIVFEEKNVFTDSFTVSDLYEYSAENSFITKLKNELENPTLFVESERIEKYEIKECCKCRKNMEVSKTLTHNNYEYSPKYVRFACKFCIESFYSSALDTISYRVYDKYGNPVNKTSPKLI